MVKPAKPKNIDNKIADNFANKANYDIKSNAVNKKRGNPRQKKNKTVSISIPLSLDAQIDDLINQATKQGVYGITRSDIVVAALRSQCMTVENMIKSIQRIKTK